MISRPKHLVEKAIDTARAFSEGAFSDVQDAYDESYAERMDAFAQTERYKDELSEMVEGLRINQDTRLLDFGCNTGQAMAWVREQTGCDVRGIDQNRFGIRIGRERFPELTFDHYEGLILPYEDETFDAVMVNHVLGHVPDPQRSLEEIRRVLRPGGRVGVITPNKLYKLGMLPQNLINDYKPDPTVLRYYSPKDLEEEIQTAGFRTRRIDTFGEIVPWLSRTSWEALRIRVLGVGEKGGN